MRSCGRFMTSLRKAPTKTSSGPGGLLHKLGRNQKFLFCFAASWAAAEISKHFPHPEERNEFLMDSVNKMSEEKALSSFNQTLKSTFQINVNIMILFVFKSNI